MTKNINRYFKEDDVQYLEVINKYGSKIYFIVDEDMVDIMKTRRWYAMYCPHRRSHYLESNDRIKYHRLITNCPNNLVVDHIDRNTYDNRISNLRVCTVAENNKNREVAHFQRNPKPTNTGYQYISRINNGNEKYYYYKVAYRGARKNFKTLEDAKMFLEKIKKERVEV